MTDELNLSDMNWCKTEIERLRKRVKEYGLENTKLKLAGMKQKQKAGHEAEALRRRVKELEAEVEAECERRWAGNAESSKDIAILGKEIEELRKAQGEPVAWTSGKKFDGDLETDDEPHEGWFPLYTSAPSIPEGEVVVTWDESMTSILAVTRQDAEGRVLRVIAEAAPKP